MLPEIPLIIKEDYRTHLITDITDASISENVTFAGWVASVRDHGELIFIDLRDSSAEKFQVRLSRESFPNLVDSAQTYYFANSGSDAALPQLPKPAPLTT